LAIRGDVLPTPNRAGLPKAALGTKFVIVEAVRRRLPEVMVARLLMDNSRYP
jgi:hypothetical protein